MIGNILKTVGLCLTSLNAFNIQEQRNQNTETTEDTITIDPYSGTHPTTLQYGYNDPNSSAIKVVSYDQWIQNLNMENCQVNVITKVQTSQWDISKEYDLRTLSTTNGIFPYCSAYTLIKITNAQNVPAYINTGEITTYLSSEKIDPGMTFNYTIQANTGVVSTSENLPSVVTDRNDAIITQDEEWRKCMYSKCISLVLGPTTTQVLQQDQTTYESGTGPSPREITENDITIAPDGQNYYKMTNQPIYIMIYWWPIGNNTPESYTYMLNNFDLTVKTINAQMTTEVVDIPGLCFDILTMPFTFISSAFNLTLFPGTPYQVNISNLFLSILGILIFVYIMRKLLSR